jgi:CheY-like chemotaxis protein
VPQVLGNAGALREVITNLVINSIDAMPAGGQIAIRTWSEGAWVYLAVADTGVGMTEEVRQRAVEPFFTTKGRWSTGLGLSVNYGTVKQHGGHLDIESAEGRGTTVTIRLPSCEVLPDPARSAPAVTREATPRRYRVLVVDDDTRVREVLSEQLAKRGHTVVAAAGGVEALAMLERVEPVDLVVTDLGMPGMNGWELARAIRTRWPRLPIVLLTGWGSQVEAARADRAAVDLVIAKPVTAKSWDEVLDLCVRRRDSASS